MKIFVGFFEAAGYFSSLSKALNSIGEETSEYYYFDNKFKYNKSKYLYFEALKFFYKNADSRGYYKRNFSKVFFNVFAFFFYLYCLVKFELFIFSSQSFFFYWGNGWEFKILKFFRKKTVFIFTGSDSRAPFLSGYHTHRTQSDLISVSLKKMNFLSTFKSKTDFVIDLPSTSHLHVVPVIDFFKIGIPKVLSPQIPLLNKNSRPKVIHAPSVQKQKGSHLFKNIIIELQDEIDFEYIEVSGIPNQELLKLISECDLVIDEMYSDSLMAGIACESAWLGTPYLVFGERLNQAAEYYSWIAKNYGRPEEAKNMIKDFILDGELRLKTALALQEFVKKNWSPDEIAKKILKISLGDEVPELLIPPNVLNELCLGWGARKKDILEMISKASESPDISKVTSHFIVD